MALSRLLDTTPPSLLTTAACGGLRPAPDCRPRRALLHLSYSSAPSHSDGAFVTHAPKRTSLGQRPSDGELGRFQFNRRGRYAGRTTRLAPCNPGGRRGDRRRLLRILPPARFSARS